jgi:hypothetical protein
MAAFPIIITGQPGFGLDGTDSYTASNWQLIDQYSLSITANDVTNPLDWVVINDGGRLKITPPNNNIGGVYQIKSKLGAGATALSTKFRSMSPAEAAATPATLVKGVSGTVQAYRVSGPGGVVWAIYNDLGVLQANISSPGGWLVTIVDPVTAGAAYPARINITPPTTLTTDLTDWSIAGSFYRATFNVAMVAPVVPPPSEDHGQGVEIRIYDRAGKRRRLPTFQVGECSWTIEPTGGFGDFSLSIAARPDELTSIAAGDRIEIYKFAQRQYRGYIGDITRSEDEPPTLTLSGYGRILDLERMVLDAVYQRPLPVDISDLFAEIAADVQAKFPKIAVSTDVIGVTISALDCRNKTAREALSDLCSTAPSACHYGFDADESGRDRLYLRKIDLSAADTTITIPGANVGHREVVQSVSDVVNAVVVEGGTPDFPQLIPNGSFEVLSKFSDDSGGAGNLLENPSFESGASQNSATGWTFSGGASNKKNGHEEAGAYAGDWSIELDQSGEKISQTQTAPAIPLVQGNDYTVGIWSRPELFASTVTPPTATCTFSWRNSSGAFTVAGTWTAKADVSAYRQYEATFRCPTGATGFKFEVTRTSTGTFGASKGIMVDSAYVFDNSSLIASGWGIRSQGTAVVQAVNWAARGAWHGRNCLYLSALASDADNNDIHVRLTPDYLIEIVGGQKFRFNFHFRGVNATAFTPKLQGQIQYYKQDGSKTGSLQRYDLPSQSAATWQYFSAQSQAPGDAVKCEAWIAVRGSGEVLLDAISLRDAAENEETYLPEGNFVARFTAIDLVTSEENADVHGSIATYGLRERVERFDGIGTFADARSVAKGYLIANASGLPAPQVDLYDDRRPLWIGYRVRLSGPSGTTYSVRVMPIMRINGNIDGNGLLTHGLELSKPVPTDEELIARLAKDKSRSASSTVAANGAASASVPTGSSSSGGSSSVAGVESVNSLTGAITVAGSGGITATTSGTTVTLDGSGIAATAGVSTINTLTGAVTVAAGSGIELSASGNTLILTNTAPGAEASNGVLRIRRNFGEGEILGLSDDYMLVITDSAYTTHNIAWNNDSGYHVDSQTIWNCKSSGNITVGPGTGNTFSGVGGAGTITLTPGQMLKCIAFEVDDVSHYWTVYTKVI